MHVRTTRRACALTIGAAPAADPARVAPSATVVDRQAKRDHMHVMSPNFGERVADCIAMHGSMAFVLGPNGSMVDRMAAAPTEAGR